MRNGTKKKSHQNTIVGKKQLGAIFACTENSYKECIEKGLFGAGKAHEDKVLDTKKGDILFLHNMDSDTLEGPYIALCDGIKNIDEKAWRGMYPYQVKIKSDKTIHTIDNFTKKSKQLNLDWRNNRLDTKQINILSNLLLSKLSLSDMLQEDVWGVQKNNQKPTLETTTLWDYPRQSYGTTKKGNNKYAGVTPAHVIYNMVKRYTERNDLVVDPMCGSGTTIDVCKEEHRKCIGYDVVPTRSDIIKNDSRIIPLDDNVADMVFIDSPYSDNIKYNESPDNIGHLSAESKDFYEALDSVASQCHRILKPEKVIGWLIGDQWVRKKFTPVSFNVYQILENYFEPMDVIAVVRRNQSSNTGMWHNRAIRHNFYLRGYKSLLIFKKTDMIKNPETRKTSWQYYKR